MLTMTPTILMLKFGRVFEMVELHQTMNDYIEICREMSLLGQAKEARVTQSNQTDGHCFIPQDDGDQHIQSENGYRNVKEEGIKGEVSIKDKDMVDVCVENEVDVKSQNNK